MTWVEKVEKKSHPIRVWCHDVFNEKKSKREKNERGKSLPWV